MSELSPEFTASATFTDDGSGLLVFTALPTAGVAAELAPFFRGDQGPAAKVETSPSYTYAAGMLSRIDYSSGNYKLFSYSSGRLQHIDYFVGLQTTRKTFNYNPDGTVASVIEAVI